MRPALSRAWGRRRPQLQPRLRLGRSAPRGPGLRGEGGRAVKNARARAQRARGLREAPRPGPGACSIQAPVRRAAGAERERPPVPPSFLLSPGHYLRRWPRCLPAVENRKWLQPRSRGRPRGRYLCTLLAGEERVRPVSLLSLSRPDELKGQVGGGGHPVPRHSRFHGAVPPRGCGLRVAGSRAALEDAGVAVPVSFPVVRDACFSLLTCTSGVSLFVSPAVPDSFLATPCLLIQPHRQVFPAGPSLSQQKGPGRPFS